MLILKVQKKLPKFYFTNLRKLLLEVQLTHKRLIIYIKLLF